MLSAGAAARRALPSVDRLLNDERAGLLLRRYGRDRVLEALRAALDAERTRLAQPSQSAAFDENAFFETCSARLEAETRPTLKRVHNLTGTVLHTNLGRAVMPQCAAEAVMRAMTAPVNLEFDLEGAARGERDSHVERWLARLTGGEAAAVVNNNAAAVYLALNTLALRKEVLVSRGELIEIGGAFRMPDIMKAAGCRLVEVGTTNRTHARDYETACGARTGALVRAHRSNYAITGFTAEVSDAELAAIAHKHGVPYLVDLGAGALIDLAAFGLPREPQPQQPLAAGADVVTFSGDKLLGGPQAGLIVGRKDAIERIRKDPLKRALRVSKLTIAALEATLRIYASGQRLPERLPTLALLTRSPSDIRAACERIAAPLAAALGGRFAVAIEACASQIGSGSLPEERLASFATVVRPVGKASGRVIESVERRLRELPVPVLGRIASNGLWLDARCLLPRDEAAFVVNLARL